ncbi:MAG TPA: alpha/beta hydrolase [Longimicrobiales bacterium]|nr:alpha/beta hydrolase [Longimicrobiales bacterium]
MPATLHTQRIAAPDRTPDRWLFLLHGIFGAGRNWNAVSRRIVEARPEWGVLAVDLRGHGRSDSGAPPHTLEACVDDLLHLPEHGAPPAAAVLGHSFGGKVATLFAEAAELESLWIADSTPSAREPGGSAWEMIDVLEDHPGPFRDRDAGIAAVESAGYARPVAMWMGTNIERGSDDAWRWRLDAEQMRELLIDFFEVDAWPAIRSAAEAGTRVRLIRATESSIVSEEDRTMLQRLHDEGLPVERIDVEGGHWLNADAPDRVAEILAEGL